MAHKLNHLHFKTPDPQKTAQWYVDNLGATISSENKNAAGQTTYRLDLCGIPVNVTPFIETQDMNRQRYGLEHIAIDTDDYDGELAKIKAGGTKILEEHTLGDGRRICFFEGPEGVQVEFLQAS